MKKTLEIIKGMAITATIIAVCFVLCLVIQYIFDDTSLVPAIFVLGVFLTSVITKGYIYGIFATVISVMAVNFAFTFPLFAFDFTIPENIISALILFLVSIITCSLTIKIYCFG